MTYVLAAIPPLAIAGDPLAGILVGGVAGVIAAVLGAALLGVALNALRRLAGGHQFPSQMHGTNADAALCHVRNELWRARQGRHARWRLLFH